MKGAVGDTAGLEARKSKNTARAENHKTHNHALTKRARADRRERRKQHSVLRHRSD